MSEHDPIDWDELDAETQHELVSLADKLSEESGQSGGRTASRREFLGAITAAGLGGSLLSQGADRAFEDFVNPASAGTQSVAQFGEAGEPFDFVAEEIYGPGGKGSGDAVNFEAVDTDGIRVHPTLEHITTLSNASLGRPHDMEVRGRTGLVPGKDGNVSAVSLFPRDNPSVMDTATSFTDAQTVAAAPEWWPTHRWFAGDANGLESLLVQPGVIANSDSIATSNSEINGSAWYHADRNRTRSYLFVALKSSGVAAIEVTATDGLAIQDEIGTSLSSPHDVAVFGTRVVACEQGDGVTPKLSFINAVNGSTTLASSTMSEDDTFSDPALNGANRLEALNNQFLVVANNIANTIATVEINGFSAADVSIADVADTGATDGPSGLAVVGDYAITASDDRVTTWDLSDPTTIQQVDQHVFGSAISGHDMAVDGRYCYVTGQSTNTIEVFDLGTEFGLYNRASDLAAGGA